MIDRDKLMARLLSLFTFLLVAAGAFAQEATFHIERIEVRGTRFTSASVIEKETLLREGETYTEAQIKAAIDRVNRLSTRSRRWRRARSASNTSSPSSSPRSSRCSSTRIRAARGCSATRTRPGVTRAASRPARVSSSARRSFMRRPTSAVSRTPASRSTTFSARRLGLRRTCV